MAKKQRLQRHTPHEPRWQPMRNGVWQGDPDDPLQKLIESEPGFVGVFINNLYQVTYRDVKTEDNGEPATIAWLCIRRLDSEPIHDWRHLQQIKNDLCGKEREALEIYPAESRLVDTSNQYHLWVLPEGVRLPFGYLEREVSDVPFGHNKNRAFVDPPEDLNARVHELDPETGRPRCTTPIVGKAR